MAVLEGLLMAGAVGLIIITLLNGAQRSEQDRRLRDAFYTLLETQDSCVSLIQLAANSRADAARTKAFLDTQAQVFSAMLEIDPDGNTFYRFPKVQPQNRLPAIIEDDWQEKF